MLIYWFMRIGLLPLLLINCLTGMIYAKPTSGQEVLDRKINLVAEQKPVKAVLGQISKLADIKFVYSVQKIPADKRVSLTAHDQRLGAVLDQLLQPLDIHYHVSGDQIVLTQKTGQGQLMSLHIDADKMVPDNYLVKVVTGRVTDEAGVPLNGVSIQIKGTSRGTTSGADGRFSINVEPGETLDFTMIGYKVYSIKVAAETTINVQLEPDIQAMSEVVVVGYGTQKRSTLTGAIASVNSKTIAELPVASVEQALQGRVSGVTVTNNGSPGTSALVRIRGISSISFASDPLYVIDGFPTGNLSNFDTRDIEGVEVLKDASAAAIYGSRATNGVIIISTKKGRRDNNLKVSLDAYVGTQRPWNKIDLLNTQQYLQYERALNGAADIALPPRLEPANFNQPLYEGTSQTYAQTNTDWQDAYFKSGIITQQNVNVSGGNEKSRFYSSAGYFKQDGIAQGVDYERGNFRINSDHNISKLFTFGQNLYFSYSDQRYDNTSGNRTRLVNVVRSMPYLPVYDPTTLGGFRGAENSVDGADPTNPVEDAILLGDAHNKTFKLLGTAFLEVNFTPWLKFRSTFGVDYVNLFQHQFLPKYDDKGRNSPVATITDLRSNTTTKLYTQQLTFDKTFGRHHVNAVAVFETQGQKYYQENASGNQNSNDIETLDGASNLSIRTIEAENFLVSYIGRVSYEFGEKYLLSAAIRRDGLSIWAPGKKYASFPSASIGWKIDREPFMQNIKAISELKIRAGYGETGLDAVNAFYNVTTGGVYYPWQVAVRANGATYPFGNENTTGNASYYNTLSNPNLEWEKTKQTNIGLDLGLLDNTITLSAEYFRRKTDNLILNVPTPGSFGFNGVGSYLNAASMENKGFELQAGYYKTKGSFNWNATGNITFIRNKVLKMNTPNATIDQGGDADFGGGAAITRTAVGQPIQSYYGYIVEGIFQSEEEVQRSPVQVPGNLPSKRTAAGDLKFKDLNGDGKITDADRTYLGSYIPDFSYALNLGANYKNFDLSLFFQGVQGNKIFNAARVITEGMARLFNSGTAVLDAWTPTNTDTDVPRAISADPNQNVRPSTRWIEDGSYLRLKNVILGYNIPGSRLKSFTRGAISSFRVYVSSQNLLTFTGYNGWDPEIGSKNTTLTNGIDYGQYPAARSFQFGIQVGF